MKFQMTVDVGRKVKDQQARLEFSEWLRLRARKGKTSFAASSSVKVAKLAVIVSGATRMDRGLLRATKQSLSRHLYKHLRA